MPGEISISISRNGEAIGYPFVIEDRPYTDSVFRCAPIEMRDGDELSVDYDLVIRSYTDWVLTGTKVERFAYLHHISGGPFCIRFVRFTKIGDEAQIRVYEHMPADIQQFDSVWPMAAPVSIDEIEAKIRRANDIEKKSKRRKNA